MDTRLQRRVQRYGWDRAAEHYERSWSAQLAPAQDRLLALADLRPGEAVLEVACGTGLVTLPAARAVGPGGRVLATDISDGMVEETRARAADAGITWVECARVSAEELDVEKDAFDAALCALGLMYVTDPPVALRRLRHALREGGRAVFAVWGERRNCGWAGIFPVVDERVHTEVCPLFFALGNGEALADTVTEAGFADVESERLTTVLHYDTEEEAADAAFAGGPVAMAYSRFDQATRQDARRAYLETIETYRNGTGYRIPGEFVIVRGRRAG